MKKARLALLVLPLVAACSASVADTATPSPTPTVLATPAPLKVVPKPPNVGSGGHKYRAQLSEAAGQSSEEGGQR